jgi:hypothetical protein
LLVVGAWVLMLLVHQQLLVQWQAMQAAGTALCQWLQQLQLLMP